MLPIDTTATINTTTTTTTTTAAITTELSHNTNSLNLQTPVWEGHKTAYTSISWLTNT